VYDKALSGLLCCHRIFAFPFSPSEALRGIESLCAVVRSSFRFDGYSSFTPSTSLTSNTTPSTFPTRFFTIHRATRRAREVVQTQERRVTCGGVQERGQRGRGVRGEWAHKDERELRPVKEFRVCSSAFRTHAKPAEGGMELQ
jgi:hypothetical protein